MKKDRATYEWLRAQLVELRNDAREHARTDRRRAKEYSKNEERWLASAEASDHYARRLTSILAGRTSLEELARAARRGRR